MRIARSYGDLSENAEYDTARKKQGIIESRISEIEGILKTATIVEEDHDKEVVTIGNSVEVKISGEGKKVYAIGTEGGEVLRCLHIRPSLTHCWAGEKGTPLLQSCQKARWR